MTSTTRALHRRLISRLAATILLLAALPSLAVAACSTWLDKAWLNEYYYGPTTSMSNFLELFSANKDFPTSWQGWYVRVFSGVDTYTQYTFNDSTASACSSGNKTYVTFPVAGGLTGNVGMVVLYDNAGNPVDALVFDQKAPPDPWTTTTKWSTTLAAECPSGGGVTGLADRLTAQSAVATRPYYGANMYIWATQGNKDYARFPDGTGKWSDSSLTGGNTTFTHCSSNKGAIVKTVSNSVPAPGQTVTWTVAVTNTGNSSISNLVIKDSYYKGLSGDPDMTCPTPTVTTGSVAATTPDTLSGMVAIGAYAWTIPSLAKNATATLTMTCTIPATATADAVYRNDATSTTLGSSDWAQVTVTPVGPNHIRIIHDGQGGVCSGDTVTLKACADAACSSLYTATNTSVSLSPAAGWPSNPVTIDTSGTATVTYTNDVAGTVRYGVNTTSYLCDNTSNATAPNATTECDAVFAENEFVVEATDTLGSVPVAGRPHKMKVTAYRKQGGQCGIATGYQNAKALKAWYSDSASLTPNPLPLLSTAANCGSTFPAGGLPAAEPGANNVTLTFTSGTVDPFYLCTGDVGKYALAFKDTSPTIVTASSPVLTVRPFALDVVVAGNPGATAANGTVLGKAGNSMATTVRAVLWQSADDADSNGVPDTGANLADNGKTPGFDWTTTLVAAAPITPAVAAGGTVGTLTGTTTIATGQYNDDATKAEETVNVAYSEVGSFTLSAIAANFLGTAGVNVAGSTVVGRLIPDHFDTEVVAVAGVPMSCLPTLTCPTSYNGMVYSGQPFTLTVKAMSSLATPTLNYSHFAAAPGFSKAVTLSTWNAPGGGTAVSNGTLGGSAVAATAFAAGVATVTPSYTFTNSTTAPTDIYLRADEAAGGDGVTSLRGAASVEGGVKVISGRAHVDNAFGSERLALPMVTTVQYYNGSIWLTNTADGTTRLTAAPTVVPSAGLTTSAVCPSAACDASSTFAAGILDLRLTAPNAVGYADLTLNIPDWLKFKWDGTNLTAPKARGSFGLYNQPGNSKRIIYRREVR